MGGLGNQMFQYAVARRLAHVHNTQVKFDLSWFAHQSESTRHYELDRFRLKQSFITNSDRVRFPKAPITKISRIFKAIQSKFQTLGPYQLILEKSLAFDPRILSLPDNIALMGYWQSYRYFNDIRSIIIEDFSLTESLTAQDMAIVDKIEKVPSVAIHIRRGDYVNSPKTSSVHGCCSAAYYQRAMEYISQRIERPHFFVFSDDMGWAKQNIQTRHQITFVDHNWPDYGRRDMTLMRLCKHNIIANSSFSWWAAWLNTSSKKIVIGPKKYYVNKVKNRHAKDLFPPNWVRL
jgi:hypothetical protein